MVLQEPVLYSPSSPYGNKTQQLETEELLHHISQNVLLSFQQFSNDTVNASNVHPLSVFVWAAVHHIYGCCRKHV